MANGLLDFMKTPEGQGLLAAAFGGLAGARRGEPINSLGRAGLAGLSGYGGALDRQMMQQQAQAAQEFRGVQVKAAQEQIEQARRAREMEEQRRQMLPQLFQGTVQPGQASINEMGLPQVDQAATVTGQGRFNVQQAIRSGLFTPQEIESYAKLQDVGTPEVARTAEIEGPRGERLIQGFDRFGRPVGQPAPAYTAPVQVDLNGQVGFVRPQPGMQLAKTPSFSDRIASGNLAVSQERLALDKLKEGKPQFNADVGGWVYPPTQQNPAGVVIPVAGGTGPLKPPTEGQAKAVLFGSRMTQANQIFDQLEQQGFTTPSYLKGAAESVPFVGGMLGRAASVTPIVSAQEQQLEQAQRDFINAVLRRESGAVIADSEFDNARKQYFPQFGDTPEVIAQKKQNRETAMRGILYEAGPHGKAMRDIVPQAMNEMPKADMSNRGRIIVDQQTGKRFQSNGMSWTEVK
jgi:hypothetical protein